MILTDREIQIFLFMAVAVATILAQAWDDRKKLPEKPAQVPPAAS